MVTESSAPLTPALATTLNIMHLELRQYRHHELPEALGHLHTLTRLCASCRDLENLPLSLSGLVNLVHMEFTFTNITSMPPLGALTKLKTLDISENSLSALPEGVITLPNLRAVNINRNLMRSLRWADLRVLPLCTHMSPTARGTRYASYDQTNAEFTATIEINRERRRGRRPHATVEMGTHYRRREHRYEIPFMLHPRSHTMCALFVIQYPGICICERTSFFCFRCHFRAPARCCLSCD